MAHQKHGKSSIFGLQPTETTKRRGDVVVQKDLLGPSAKKNPITTDVQSNHCLHPQTMPNAAHSVPFFVPHDRGGCICKRHLSALLGVGWGWGVGWGG